MVDWAQNTNWLTWLSQPAYRFRCWSSNHTSSSSKCYISYLFDWMNFESMKWGQGYKALVKNSKTHKCIYCKHTCREMWNKKAKENETLTWVRNSHIPMHGLSEGCWEDKVIKLKLFRQMTWCLDCFMFYGRPSLDCIKSMHLPSPLSKSRKTHLYVPPM